MKNYEILMTATAALGENPKSIYKLSIPDDSSEQYRDERILLLKREFALKNHIGLDDIKVRTVVL